VPRAKEHGNEPSSSTKGGKFLDKLRYFQLLKGFAPKNLAPLLFSIVFLAFFIVTFVFPLFFLLFAHTLLFRIPKSLGSNLSPKTRYPH
jgi:hypothetical protein